MQQPLVTTLHHRQSQQKNQSLVPTAGSVEDEVQLRPLRYVPRTFSAPVGLSRVCRTPPQPRTRTDTAAAATNMLLDDIDMDTPPSVRRGQSGSLLVCMSRSRRGVLSTKFALVC